MHHTDELTAGGRSFQAMGLVRLLIALLISHTLFAAPAYAARKALIIGNGDYEQAADLANPANDAVDLAARLSELGFEVAGGGAQTNLNRDQIAAAVRAFTNSLEPGDLAMFFFAGHGAQWQGENYLIPTDDAQITAVQDLPDYAYAAEQLLARLEGRTGVTSIVIFDACRNNPLGVRTRTMGAGEGAGLAVIDPPSTAAAYIMYAAEEGKTASDGGGRNSMFTSALLVALERPDRRLEDIGYDVRKRVREESNGLQLPSSRSSLEEAVYLADPPDAALDVSASEPAVILAPEPSPESASEPAPEEASLGEPASDEPATEELAEGLNPDAGPSYDPVSLVANFNPDPQRYRVLAGGTEDASQLGESCHGFIARRPDYVVSYQAAASYPLHFSATSVADTVLIIRDPSGAWRCNDDFEGLHPAVSFAKPRSGDYRIWVGVYASDAGYPGADLLISEVEPKF